MKGLDPEVFFQLAGHRVEGVMSMGWGEAGVDMEAAYSFPGVDMADYRDLVREQISGFGMEAPGIELEYRQDVAQIGEMPVDVLIQEIQVPESSEIPAAMQSVEVYYGWGEEEILTVMASGAEGGVGIERLRGLASRQPGPIPDRVRALLDMCPEDLLMFGWIDIAGLVQGFSLMDPSAPEVAPMEGIPPVVFYGTARGSEGVYGGSVDVEALSGAASALLRAQASGRRDP
jgi:hypothetical protein